MADTETIPARLAPETLAAEFKALLLGQDRHMKRALDLLLGQAVLYRASDIHVELYQGEVRLRFRVDGHFQDVARLPAEVQEQFISRVKVMAGLTVHRRDIVQEGRISVNGTDFRISIIPTVSGEKLAVRIFDVIGRVMELEDLGFQPEVLARFQNLILSLSGTILLTGPSGSGKTTTLYAGLRRIHDRAGDHAAITTIEDPVEYAHGLFAQIQVNPRSDLTFAKALTSVLRQDPRVIMVGEIRDPDTCEIAMRAGLTGHLVLSTIHSRSACGVITRLLDMGIEPYVVTSSLRAVMAQRLARVVCKDCATPYEPDPALASLVRGAQGEFDGPFLRGRGCEACLGTGFLGRTALTELLPVDEFLAGYIGDKVGTARLEAAAREAGFDPLIADGVRKVREGRTTIEEVVRALGGEALR
jgi:type II secretory ATPase GspE/PulE/Tfp pilus assembly ATPase PilB-like protein